MRKLLLVLALLVVSPVFGQAGVYSKEVLVLLTATQIQRNGTSTSLEIQNLGPNPIYCGFGTAGTAIVAKARAIPGLAVGVTAVPGSWYIQNLNPVVGVWCIAATAAQVTGAATVVTEFTQ